MVLLLNYLPWIIFAIGVFAFYKATRIGEVSKRKRYAIISVVATIVALLLLQGLTAGYIPKKRSSNVGIGSPQFETSEAVIQDRLRPNAKTDEERAKNLEEISEWRKLEGGGSVKITEPVEATPVEPVK